MRTAQNPVTKLAALSVAFVGAIVALGAIFEMLATAHFGAINLIPATASGIATNASLVSEHSSSHVSALSYILAAIVVTGAANILRSFLKERAAVTVAA